MKSATKISKFTERFAGRIALGGPLRIAAWPIWSGRERSSHSHFLQVPQIRLAFFHDNSSYPFLTSMLNCSLLY